jgi:RNA recognition motif-containing protein
MERQYRQEPWVSSPICAPPLVKSSPHRYAFIEFRNADAATYALNEMNGHPFDAKHTFLVNRFTDVEKFANLDETYVEPQREEYHPKARHHLAS